MLFHFQNVTVSIKAKTAMAAYKVLSEMMADRGAVVEFSTDTYRKGNEDTERSVVKMFLTERGNPCAVTQHRHN